MKTPWIERELANVYGGADVEHRRENFRVGDKLNCFLRFIAKHIRKCPNDVRRMRMSRFRLQGKQTFLKG